jgi:hypothetical protein
MKEPMSIAMRKATGNRGRHKEEEIDIVDANIRGAEETR